MTLIADTGPVIALAKIKRLELLQVLFDEVQIPPAVYKELMAKIGDEANEIDKALDNFMRVSEEVPEVNKIKPVVRNLGTGEKSSIELAYLNKKHTLLLIDDKVGREAAKKLKILFTGTIGLMIKAKSVGLIPNVTKDLKLMRENGYWFSGEIIDKAKNIAGE